MTKSLRFRLFLSYAAITLIILLAAGMTLGLVWRGAQERIVRSRLSASLPLTARLVRSMLRQGVAPEDIAGQVSDDFAKRNSRLVLVQHGRVIGDTADGALVGKSLSHRLPDQVKRSGDRQTGGVFVGPDGREYFFALTPVLPPPDASDRAPILVVQIAPRRFLGLGEEIAAPLIWAVLAALLVGLAFSWLISRWIIRPLTAIARAADEIAQGNLDFQLQVSGPAEVEHVADQFNNMAAEVRASRQAQRDFIANVSHDLKTPLTAIQGFSQALVEGVASDPAGVQRAAAVIHDESLRMSRLVDQLLDLAKLEAGRVQMRRQRIDLAALLGEAAERFQPAAQERDITLTVAAEPDLWIQGDADRLLQVFVNLLDNALRHTPEQGSVICRAVHVADAADKVEVTVGDTGPGIPPEDLSHVFDRFYQAEKARRRGSSGLGLAIVQEIVRTHDGEVGVFSEPGQGATFWVRLPRDHG
jgi:signal transduction histidine kinase